VIRVGKGPLMQQYADCFGCDVVEVVEWVNQYVNGPWSDSQRKAVEPTEAGRLAAIKGYIEAMVNDSVTGRIRADLARRKAA
jgi:hypothetical protein